VTRVNSANVLDEGLRMGERTSDELEGKDSHKQEGIQCLLRQSVDYKLDLDVSLAGLSWPLFIGGQVLKIRSGSI
jgi:hypothetical protein